jgi:hypothetical protein
MPFRINKLDEIHRAFGNLTSLAAAWVFFEYT